MLRHWNLDVFAALQEQIHDFRYLEIRSFHQESQEHTHNLVDVFQIIVLNGQLKPSKRCLSYRGTFGDIET